MNKEYNDLAELIKSSLPVKEPSDWNNLFETMKVVKSRGYMTKEEFMQVCMWKSPRPKKKYLSNSKEHVEEATKLMFLTNLEEIRVGLLQSLEGVSIPVASAILTLIDPKNYGVIDIRVWQMLYLYGEVKNKPSGQGFTIRDWKEYLSILRKYASQFQMKVRDIEITLFFHHRKIQVGNLYSAKKQAN